MENIINLGLTQARDTKDSSSASTSANSEGDSGFASLVEQHINAGKADKSRKVEATNRQRDELTDNNGQHESSTKRDDIAVKKSKAANAGLDKERQTRTESAGQANKTDEHLNEASVKSAAIDKIDQETASQSNQATNAQTNNSQADNTDAKTPALSSASKLLELVNRSELLIQQDNNANGKKLADGESQTDDGLITLPTEKRTKQDRLFTNTQGIAIDGSKQVSSATNTESTDTENTDDGQTIQRIQALAQAQQNKTELTSNGEAGNNKAEAGSASKVTETARSVLDHELSIKERLLAGRGGDLSQKHLIGQPPGAYVDSAASSVVLSHAANNSEQQIKQTSAGQAQQIAAELAKVKTSAESELAAQQQSLEVQTDGDLVTTANTLTPDSDAVLTQKADTQVAANTTGTQQQTVNLSGDSGDNGQALTAQSSELYVGRQVIAGQANPEQERNLSSQTNSQANTGSHHRTVDLSAGGQSNTSQGNSQSSSNQQGQNSNAQLTTEQPLEQDIVVAESDKNSLKPEQQAHRSSAFQATLDAASQANERSIQQARTSTEQQTYLDEVANQVTQDNVQVQKKQAAQLTETINIYRKDFSAQLKDKVMVMVSQKLQQVDIQLDPPELGNVQVRVNLQNEQAAVSFVVQNQQAKEALEQNINRLKDMLAGSGVDVGDANIEQRDQQSQEQLAQGGSGTGRGAEHQEQDHGQVAEHDQQSYMVKGSAVGVDYYA
ncbi:flagellar hook-length control protein FliK [Endozoicomonas sp. G2_1]|uniref:flagellar hook-length control protein FliK n=1 Tax=Endozoicomonas sp. G2_1 TaxID=2821091 RepID=UPI001ADB39C7|nr:flagellar hook-length control protein FliK [Endozoicomonas sp. G2_1]MBO9491735.1 flagellar hook-length control protein FliK [Endozoicomonas sp. G2_1]